MGIISPINSRVQNHGRFLFLCLFGVLDSFYLLHHHVAVTNGLQKGTSLCNLGGFLNCDQVALSRYSIMFGQPLASYGLFYYCFCVFSVLFLRLNDCFTDKPKISNIKLFLAFSSLPFTFWSMFVSYFILKYVCLGCSLLYLCNFLLCFVSFRERDTGQSFFYSLISGLSSLYSYFFSRGLTTFPYFRSSLWCFVFCLLLTVYFLPQFIFNLLKANQESAKNSLKIVSLYANWLKQPNQDIPIVIQSDEGLGDLIRGNKEAPITIVEFSDFECPACRKASEIFHRLLRQFPNEIRLVYKNFPLDSKCNQKVRSNMHKYSCMLANMSVCAGKQNEELFWQMHDIIFDLPLWKWTEKDIEGLSFQVDMNIGEYNLCLEKQMSAFHIQSDVELASHLGINSTPTIFINGRRVDFGTNFGLESLEGLLQMIINNKTF